MIHDIWKQRIFADTRWILLIFGQQVREDLQFSVLDLFVENCIQDTSFSAQRHKRFEAFKSQYWTTTNIESVWVLGLFSCSSGTETLQNKFSAKGTTLFVVRTLMVVFGEAPGGRFKYLKPNKCVVYGKLVEKDDGCSVQVCVEFKQRGSYSSFSPQPPCLVWFQFVTFTSVGFHGLSATENRRRCKLFVLVSTGDEICESEQWT